MLTTTNEIPQSEQKLILCKAISKMHTNKFYVPQWDEVNEKVIFVVSDYPKCVSLETTSYTYSCYEWPVDAEMIAIGYQIIP